MRIQDPSLNFSSKNKVLIWQTSIFICFQRDNVYLTPTRVTICNNIAIAASVFYNKDSHSDNRYVGDFAYDRRLLITFS